MNSFETFLDQTYLKAFLQQPLTLIARQTRQALYAINQSMISMIVLIQMLMAAL
jgi:hypothetical protein